MAPASLQDHTEGGTTLLGFGLTCSPDGPLTGVSPTAVMLQPCLCRFLPLMPQPMSRATSVRRQGH